MVIECKIASRRVWCVQTDSSRAALEDISKCLSFEVPGKEHMPLFKQGRWDGVRHFFDWRTKAFSVGLLGYVKRKTAHEFSILTSDIDTADLEYVATNNGSFGLRDYQENAVRSLLSAGGGIASIATNGGKTACMAAVAKACVAAGKRVTVLEGRVELLSQVKTEIETWSQLTLGQISAGVCRPSDCMIVMVPTAAGAIKRVMKEEASDKDVDIYDNLSDVDVWIVDEAHHATSASYVSLLDLSRKALRFGFSGTIASEDSIAGISIREVLGDVVCVVKNAELIDKNISAKPKINIIEYDVPGLSDKIDEFKQSIRGTCMKMLFDCYGPDGKAIMKYGFSVPTFIAKVKEFVMNYSVKQSNEFWGIVKSITNRHAGTTMVIMVDWVDFGEDLAKHLGIEILHGQLPAGKRQQVLSDFRSGKLKHIVSTSVLDEGISIDQIKVLVLATVGKSHRQFLQRIGRGLRKKAGVNELVVYDFMRYGHKYLLEPSKARLALWRSEGFDVEFVEC